MSSLSKDFTKGNITKQLILFSLPFMASNALQVLYSVIDMIIVGKFVGTAGLAAVSLSSQIVLFVTMLTLGFSNAGQVLISQALGAGKKKGLELLFVLVYNVLNLCTLPRIQKLGELLGQKARFIRDALEHIVSLAAVGNTADRPILMKGECRLLQLLCVNVAHQEIGRGIGGILVDR